MITINNLCVSYGSSKVVLNGLNLSLELGAIHGIVGLNGAGKTTLLNAIFGLCPFKGEIMYKGQRLTKRSMAYLPAENFFYSYITGAEYLALFNAKAPFDANKWAQLLELPLDQDIDGFSTGMKKKLALLAIIKQNKPILILDEPFNGLDVESCRLFRSVLLRLKDKGTTILVTSHIIETLTSLCDSIHYLEDGAIKESVGREGLLNFQQKLYTDIEDRSQKMIDDLM